MSYLLRILYQKPIQDPLEVAIDYICSGNGGQLLGSGSDGAERDQDWLFELPDRALFVAFALMGISELTVSIKRVDADT